MQSKSAPNKARFACSYVEKRDMDVLPSRTLTPREASDPCRILGGTPKVKRQKRPVGWDLQVRRKTKRTLGYRKMKIKELLKEAEIGTNKDQISFGGITFY